MIDPKELRIETVDPLTGGMITGTIPVKVKVTHLPTGTTAICGVSRKQHVNKRLAVEAVEWMLSGEGA